MTYTLAAIALLAALVALVRAWALADEELTLHDECVLFVVLIGFAASIAWAVIGLVAGSEQELAARRVPVIEGGQP